MSPVPPSARTARSRRHHVGFTLVEVMLVVAILSVLATLAIPGMMTYTMKAKRAERQAMMSSIGRAVVEFLEEGSKTALNLPPNPTAPGGLGRQPFDNTLGDWSQLVVRPDGPLYYRYSVVMFLNATPPTFEVRGSADLDHNGVDNIRVITYTAGTGGWSISQDDGLEGTVDRW